MYTRLSNMSREVMLGMLRQGNNGNEILSILDVISGDSIEPSTDTNSAAVSYNTGEAIEF